MGGHFEADESPEECVLREVKEETGYTLTSYRFRGIVTFVSGNGVTEYMMDSKENRLHVTKVNWNG